MRLVHLAKMQEKMSKVFSSKPAVVTLDCGGGGDAGSEDEADEHDLIVLGGSSEDAEVQEDSKVDEPVSDELSSDPPSLL